MIERFDVLAPSLNPVYNLFRSEHIRRYQIAADFLAGMPSDGVIVDAACGCGYGYDFLSPLGQYVGLDCSVDAIESCRVRYPYGDFRVANLDSPVPFHRIGPFDAVVSLETGEHLRWPSEFLASVHRSLEPNGKFVFSAPTSLTMDFDPYHLRDWNSCQWYDALVLAGFSVESIEPMPFSATFWQFLQTTPTTWRQKGAIVVFMIRHPKYLLNRLWNWGIRNRFYWESTLYCCVKN